MSEPERTAEPAAGSAAGRYLALSADMRGKLHFACGMLGFTMVDALAKHLGNSLPVLQILWARYLFHFLVLATVMAVSARAQMRTLPFVSSLPQAAALIATAGLYFAALRFIPLSTASMLFLLSPICVIVLTRLVLKERATKRQLSTVVAGIAGACLILEPSITNASLPGTVLILVAALANASYIVLVRGSRRSATPLERTVATSAIAAALLSVAVPIAWQAPTGTQWMWLVLIGVLGALAQTLLIVALNLAATTSRVVPLVFLDLIGAICLGIMIFHEAPTITQLLGAFVIGIGVIVNMTERQLPTP